MYRFIVKIEDKWVDLDLPGDEPAMNYQANDLTELKDRQADYSQEIALPKTANNVRLLQFVSEFNGHTSVPYVYHECRLYSNDFTIAGIGSVMKIRSVTKEAINIMILSGTVDIFEEMKNTIIANLQYDSLGYIIVGDQSNISYTDSQPVLIGSLDTATGVNNYGVYDIEKWNYINLVTLCGKIVSDCGYTLKHNIDLSSALGIYFSFPTMKPIIPQSLENVYYTSDVSGNSRSFNNENWGDNWHTFGLSLIVKNDNDNRLSAYQGNFNNSIGSLPNTITDEFCQEQAVTLSGIIYTSNIEGTVKVNIAPWFNYTAPTGLGWTQEYCFFMVILVNSQTFVYDWGVLQGTDIWRTGFGMDIPVKVGTQIKVCCFILMPKKNHPSNAKLDMSNIIMDIKFSVSYCDRIPKGGRLYVRNNLTFKTYLDVFKAFVQTFGLTVYVDQSDKTVYAYTFDKLYDNKSIAKDWSDRIIDGDSEQTFQLDDYGQRNIIKMSDDGEVQDIGMFEIGNDTLEAEKELFSMHWKAGKDITQNNTVYPFIPLYEYSEDNTREYKGADEHLIYGTNKEHLKAQTIVDTYYSKLSGKLLKYAKILEIELMLTDMDIQDFNPFVPVYIKQFGKYFYVNKISNYISGKPTKVTLIKM